MEVSRRIWVRYLVRWAYEAKRSELAIDRLCAVHELGMMAFGLGRNLGFEEEVEAHSIGRAVEAIGSAPS
jgi:hypothetical protein